MRYESASTVSGRLVELRPIGREDYPALFGWRADIGSVNMLNFRRRITTFEEFVHELERTLPEWILLLVEELSTGKPIGFAVAYSIDQWDGWLYVAVFVEPKYRFRGHGGEASLLALDAVFRWFPVRRVYTEIYEFAGPLIQMARAMGFDEVGYQPDHYWHNERFWGVYRMCLTREKWSSQRDHFAAVLTVQDQFQRLQDEELGASPHAR